MKNFILAAVLFLAAGALAAPRPLSQGRAKPSNKVLPKTTAPEPVGPEGVAPALATRPVAVQESAEAAGGKSGESLDVTITGEAKDQIPVVIDPPPLDIDFKDVVGLSRDGQTERVVSGPVETVRGGELLSLALLEPRQVAGSLPAKIPSPPFIQMEIATGLEPAKWDFRVLDQNNRVVHRQESSGALRDLLSWDGFENSELKILTGQVYTPVLIATGKGGAIDRYYGEPVLLDLLQYAAGNERRVEFFNERLFNQGSAEIPRDMGPPMKALLSLLRRRAGSPVQVIVHFTPDDRDIAQARVTALKTLLEESLLWEPGAITFLGAAAGERGDITQIVITGGSQ